MLLTVFVVLIGVSGLVVLFRGSPILAEDSFLSPRGGKDRQFQVSTAAEEVFVPAGRFLMGCTQDSVITMCDGDARPIHAVYLDAFYIDKTEVTNSQYAACVLAGACEPPLSNSSKTREDYYDDPVYADYPVIHVDWGRADAYCRWRGKRLPTEAEWEKAARGPDMRMFPWGSTAPTCETVNFNDCVGDTVRVGSYPDNASPYGALDMIGNVREWVNDLYVKHYYTGSPYYNPQGPDYTDKGEHLVRGGSWLDSLRVGANPWVRLDEAAIYYTELIGFRCVRTAIEVPPTPTPTPIPTPTATPPPFAVRQIDTAGGAVWMTTPSHLTLLHVPGGKLGSGITFTITYQERDNQQGGRQGMNHFFRLSAVSDQPDSTNYLDGRFYPSHELFLGFQEHPGVDVETLRLYRLGPSGWTTDDITITERAAGYIRAQVRQVGIYGLLGETQRLYLPLIARH
jgi:formylglycine-generating enzyme required for sulfatase activity